MEEKDFSFEKEGSPFVWYMLVIVVAIMLLLYFDGIANGQEILDGINIETSSTIVKVEKTMEQKIIDGDIVGEEILTQEINPLKVKIKTLDENASLYAKKLDYYRYTCANPVPTE